MDACTALGDANPLVSVHDVGAGGLSNALPELVWEWERGAKFNLRAIPVDDPSMSPMEIWCNESQERYVFAILEKDLEWVQQVANRERCPLAIVGQATEEKRLVLWDEVINQAVIDLPMDVLFSKVPRMQRSVVRQSLMVPSFAQTVIGNLPEAIERVLSCPTVGSKAFLITIGDRSVTGLVTREQMVGKWQVPVADVGVAALSYHGLQGQAMSMGERPALAILDSRSAAKVAIGEALLNLWAAPIAKTSDVKLSCNWMCAAGHEDQGALLYDAVMAVGLEMCPALDIVVPVGKDSMSMKVAWKEGTVTSPVTLIVSAFSLVENVAKVLTPEMQRVEKSKLVWVNLGQGRLGASVLAEVYAKETGAIGGDCPTVNVEQLKDVLDGLNAIRDLILAYHDVSDGGMFTTVVEMCFAGRMGVSLDLQGNVYQELFAEELGVVLQIYEKDVDRVLQQFNGLAKVIGHVTIQQDVLVKLNGNQVYKSTRAALQKIWSKTSWEMAKRRDNPTCVEQEYSLIDENDERAGLSAKWDFEICPQEWKDLIARGSTRPKVAILREQGVNGHVEMAAAFTEAGFQAFDLHMSDLLDGSVDLQEFVGIAACGGFSYGDVLGAGVGWAQSVLLNPVARRQFESFFQRPDTFMLGVCNGCQMTSLLGELSNQSGQEAVSWPRFVRNKSEQFEARTCMLKIQEGPSIFFKGMEGSVLPVAVAHGEGRVSLTGKEQGYTVACNYVDGTGQATEVYPLNPNGSAGGVTGLTSLDGRVTILMPHPERCWTRVCNSVLDGLGTEQYGPWFRMFVNARLAVEK